ncbi:MAG: fructose-1,6-bisphosphatase [Candidatus Bathyarchaeia archaeon]
MGRRTTISVIKCDVGSLVGHHVVPKPILDIAEKNMREAKKRGSINSYYVFNVGDDVELLMVHDMGESNAEIHQIAWETFQEAAEKARRLKLYGAGQDLLKNAFTGTVSGLGPGVAEMEIEERESDPIVILAADKAATGIFNLPVFRIFADPMNTAGLVIDPLMIGGFKFEVIDLFEDRKIVLKCPEEMYELVALIGSVKRYIISRVWRAEDNLIGASISITSLEQIAGKYVGKDDPVAIIRAQHGLPALGEILAPFMHSYLTAGWMRGSHWGPVMPVGLKDAKCTIFDGPPRIVALGLQISDGKIAGDDEDKPMIADLFDDPAFEPARKECLEYAAMLRRMGEFEPSRLSVEYMEYTAIIQVIDKLKNRFRPVSEK